MKTQIYLVAILVAFIAATSCSSSTTDPTPNTPADTTPTGPTTPVFGTVTDINGNVYKTVTLGTQTWMAENLRVNKFNDGTPIKNIVNRLEWMSTKKFYLSESVPAYCWLNNDSATNAKPFGAYYNSFVINSAANGNKNIAPKGWHVPTNYEWEKFHEFLTENGYGINNNGDGCQAKSLASTNSSTTDKYGWNPTVKESSLGYKPELNNKSGFNAYPNGARNASDTDTFYKQGVNAFWWVSNVFGPEPCVIGGEDGVVIHGTGGGDMSEFGMGIRCVKD